MQRREFLAGMGAAPFAAALSTSRLMAQAPAAPARSRTKIQQSVMSSIWGNQNNIPFEEKCRILQRIGFKAVDLPSVEQVPILKQYGLAPALMTGVGSNFQNGIIRKELHDMIEE